MWLFGGGFRQMFFRNSAIEEFGDGFLPAFNCRKDGVGRVFQGLDVLTLNFLIFRNHRKGEDAVVRRVQDKDTVLRIYGNIMILLCKRKICNQFVILVQYCICSNKPKLNIIINRFTIPNIFNLRFVITRCIRNTMRKRHFLHNLFRSNFQLCNYICHTHICFHTWRSKTTGVNIRIWNWPIFSGIFKSFFF